MIPAGEIIMKIGLADKPAVLDRERLSLFRVASNPGLRDHPFYRKPMDSRPTAQRRMLAATRRTGASGLGVTKQNRGKYLYYSSPPVKGKRRFLPGAGCPFPEWDPVRGAEKVRSRGGGIQRLSLNAVRSRGRGWTSASVRVIWQLPSKNAPSSTAKEGAFTSPVSLPVE